MPDPPAAQPPTTEERRWTICKNEGYAPEVLGPFTGETEPPVEVVEASAFDALARELESARKTAAEARGKCDWWQDKYHRTKDELEEARGAADQAIADALRWMDSDESKRFVQEVPSYKRLTAALAHHPEESSRRRCIADPVSICAKDCPEGECLRHG